MRLTNRTHAAVAAVLAGLIGSAGAADAQACLGLPVEGRPAAALAEVAYHTDVTRYGLRVGRDLGASITGYLDYAHSAMNERNPGPGLQRRGSGNAAGAAVAFNYELEEIPFCTFAQVRRARASSSGTHSWGYWDEFGTWVHDGHQSFSASVVANVAVLGVGTGVEARLAGETHVTPFGNVRMGWVQSRFDDGCGDAWSCGYGGSETTTHMEAEAGVVLRHRRILGGGGLRMIFSEGDPMFRMTSAYAGEPLLFTLTVGMVF